MRLQREIGEQIQTITTNYGKDSDERKTIEYLEHRLTSLDGLWKSFVKNDEYLAQFEETASSQPYYTTKFYETVEALYAKIQSKIEAKRVQRVSEKEKKQKNVERDAEKTVLINDTELKRNEAILQYALIDQLLMAGMSELAEQSAGMIEVMYESVKSAFNEWKEALLKCNRESVIGTAETQKKVSDMNKKYIRVIGDLKEAINVKKERRAMVSDSMHENVSKLPKVKIPDFSGKIEEWKVFNELYEQIIHSNSKLGNASKFHYLKSYVKGEAA